MRAPLIGAAIGAAIGVYFEDPYSGGFYIPLTGAGWVAYCIANCAPYALVGGLVGFFIGRRNRKQTT
jgi:hypothetical protein